MFKPAPSEAQIASLGLKPEDYAAHEEEIFELWPENRYTFDLWNIVGDQWRVGPNGPVSLDLVPVFHELDRAGLDDDEYGHVLIGIKAIAKVALEEAAERK